MIDLRCKHDTPALSLLDEDGNNDRAMDLDSCGNDTVLYLSEMVGGRRMAGCRLCAVLDPTGAALRALRLDYPRAPNRAAE